ncbi:MAG: hypothetical protein ACXACY_30790, partial [Candidatus Hodarchaeales archaeon]
MLDELDVYDPDETEYERGYLDMNGKFIDRYDAMELIYNFEGEELIAEDFLSAAKTGLGEYGNYTFLTKGPGAGLLFEELRQAFPGARVSQKQAPQGKFTVTLPHGGNLEIESVNQITPEEWSLVGRWRELAKEGVQPTGEYQDAKIRIRKGFGDKWTLHHETVHWMRDQGIITPREWTSLKAAAKKAIRQGKMQANDTANPGSEEDVADWFADNLYESKQGKPSTLRKILQAIESFIDSIIQGIRPTGQGFVRKFRRGEVLGQRSVSASNVKSAKMNMLSPRWYS